MTWTQYQQYVCVKCQRKTDHLFIWFTLKQTAGVHSNDQSSQQKTQGDELQPRTVIIKGTENENGMCGAAETQPTSL